MKRLPQPLHGPDFAGARCMNLIVAEVWAGGKTGVAPIYLEGTAVRSRGRLYAEFTIEESRWPQLQGRQLTVNLPEGVANDVRGLLNNVRRQLRDMFEGDPQLVVEGEAYGRYWDFDDEAA